MIVSFLYLAVRALLGLLVRSRRSPDAKDVELIVLRHELEVLRRQVGRPKIGPADRALLAAAACHLPQSSRRALLVTPPDRQNHPNAPGLYRFWLARDWDTRQQRDGPYRLDVETADIRGNASRGHLELVLVNGAV